MAGNRTFVMIKPNATKKNVVGKICQRFEDAGFTIIAQRRLRLSQFQAEQFYDIHRERPFFGELCEFMCSGPVVAMILEGENAVLKGREIMGDTNPEKAAPGTIRRDFGDSIGENAMHGSDSDENAATEMNFFFSGMDICL